MKFGERSSHVDKILAEINKEIIGSKSKLSPTAKKVLYSAAGATALASSKNLILGKKRMYHGTNKENWKNIAAQGLLHERGGLDGSSYNAGRQEFVERSLGKVHATRSPNVASLYTNMADKDSTLSRTYKSYKKKADLVKEDVGLEGIFVSDMTGKQKKIYRDAQKDRLSKEFNHHEKEKTKAFLVPNIKNGKLIKINMDYNKFKDMDIDVESYRTTEEKVKRTSKLNQMVRKNIAARGSIDILPEEIAGSTATGYDRAKHTLEKLPQYIKDNPARFGAGLGLATGGGILLAKGQK